MLEKFAEDDKLEQMNQQKRRMRELEHKKEVSFIYKKKNKKLKKFYRSKDFGKKN